MSARAALIVLALFLLVPFLLLGLSNVPGVLRRAGAIVAPPTATPRPATAPFADTLLAPGLGWVESPECRFGADGLHVVAPAVCYKRGSLFADGAVAVDVKQVGGEVGKGTYGIAFRRPAASVFYAFEITSDGRWHFINGYQELTPLTTHPAIKPGLNVTNALEVRATGQGFDFYANGERVGTGSDPLYPSGAVGLTGDTGLDVVYANLRVTGGAP